MERIEWQKRTERREREINVSKKVRWYFRYLDVIKDSQWHREPTCSFTISRCANFSQCESNFQADICHFKAKRHIVYLIIYARTHIYYMHREEDWLKGERPRERERDGITCTSSHERNIKHWMFHLSNTFDAIFHHTIHFVFISQLVRWAEIAFGRACIISSYRYGKSILFFSSSLQSI